MYVMDIEVCVDKWFEGGCGIVEEKWLKILKIYILVLRLCFISLFGEGIS